MLEAAHALSHRSKYAEARASASHLLSEMEGALGDEAEELLLLLFAMGQVTLHSGELGDSNSIMLRTLTVSEKHHGEEGLETCTHRTRSVSRVPLLFSPSVGLFLVPI